MMDQEKREREQGIRAWWEDDHPGLPLLSREEDRDVLLRRLFNAFRRVLLAMSEEQFQKFLYEINPTVVCRFTDNGCAFRHTVTAISDSPEKPVTRYLNVIYLAPWVFRRSDERLADLVAHEVAHHILGHPATMFSGNQEKDEEKADDLAEQWGFKRSSTPRARRTRRGLASAQRRARRGKR